MRQTKSNFEIFFVPYLKESRNIAKQKNAPSASAQVPYPAPSFN